MEEMKKYFEIYYEGKKEIKIKCIRPLFNMSYMFCDCSSLTSLNLYNFNSNNIKDMSYMFFLLNKNCKIETNVLIILDEIK